MVLRCDNCLYTFGDLTKQFFGVCLVNFFLLCFQFLRRAFGVVVKVLLIDNSASISDVFDCAIYQIAF